MRRILLAFGFAAFMLGYNFAGAQALLVTHTDTSVHGNTFTYTAPLDSFNEVYPELNGYMVNNSGQPDTIGWKFLNASIDSLWLGMSCCDPNNCYYIYPGPSFNGNAHYFAADTGVGKRFQFNSSPACVADSGQFQILIWLQHDSAASATVVTYKSQFTGVCATTAIPKVTASQIRIYPTPVSSQLTIEGLNNLNETGIYIYDMLGNVVLHKTISDPQSTQNINTSSLQAGVYIVGIDNNGSRVITKRIEKMD